MRSARKTAKMLQGVVNSAFQPGVNRQLLFAVNATFFLLIILLGAMTVVTGFSIPHVVLFVLSFFLYLLLLW